tara:strand:+ start:203 stop:595 length:393 start_codon:yes stop_codon:yes gene_type:complete
MHPTTDRVQAVLLLLLAHSLQQAVVMVDLHGVETGPLVDLVGLQLFTAVLLDQEYRDKEILVAPVVAEAKVVRVDTLLAELHILIQLMEILMLLEALTMIVLVYQHQLIPVVAVAEKVKTESEVRVAQEL